MKSFNMIHKTTDYSKFDRFAFNRAHNEGLITRIIDSISKIGYIEAKPVLVDDSFNIIDGQHRFEACKRLNLPIYYVKTNVNPQEAIIHLNANQNSWTMVDYVKSWAASGVECYKNLNKFEEVNRLGITSSILVLFNTADSNDIKGIKLGKVFKLNPKADDILKFITDCNIVPYSKSSFFIKSVVTLFRLATPKQIEKVKNNIISLPQQATAAAYVTSFENIINRNVPLKNRVSLRTNTSNV